MPDGSGVRCFQGILIFGNVVIGLCGLALTAECIFFVSDQRELYPLLEATDNDDIYAAAWIGIFTGFSFFLLSLLGIYGIMKSSRRVLMAYLILMFIVYCFEVASSITAATQRDFFTPELFLRQMLEFYQNEEIINNDHAWKVKGVTRTWDRLMLWMCGWFLSAGIFYFLMACGPICASMGEKLLRNDCCGVYGPQDWQNYNSAFRKQNSDSQFPWPQQCCVMNDLAQPSNLLACRVGVEGFLKMNGCYDQIAGPMSRHAWGVAWFGFAILCWTFWVLLGCMFYWTRIEY